jgi:very-short-patch-repair endonuclease
MLDHLEMIYKRDFVERINSLKTFSIEEQSQLHQIISYIKACRPNMKMLFSPSVLKTIDIFIKNSSTKKPNPSFRHMEMSETLRLIGFGHQNEYYDSGFFMDCADPIKKVDVEMDGDEYHYTTDGHLLGNNVLRDKILNAMGWDVIRIKSSEWDQLGTIENKKTFLKKLLSK